MNKLKELRLAKNMNQECLAKQLGIARTTVSMWETGKAMPRVDTLRKLAEIFGCSVDELLN